MGTAGSSNRTIPSPSISADPMHAPRLVLRLVVVATLTTAAGIGVLGGELASPGKTRATREVVSGERGEPRNCVTRATLSTWSNERLAMQTIAVPVEENSLGAATSAVREGAGGLLLFGSSAPSNLAAEISRLERHDVPGGLGLIVMTDEEGGEIQRMANLVGSLPWPRWMAEHWTTAEITRHVEAVARAMATNGVNADLAPVVDVDGRDVLPGPSDPDGVRSFGGSTAVVSRDGVAYMRGLTEGGVIAVLKHFPGLGGASGNTDDEAAHTLPWPELKKVALPAFEAGIRAGVPGVMVSNATVPGLAKYPASLSRAAVHALVHTLGFKGLVMTDSLSAVAISAAGFTLPEAAVQALVAGEDMILYSLYKTQSATNAEATAMATAIVSAVNDGHLPRSRLLAAATAVLAARHRTCS